LLCRAHPRNPRHIDRRGAQSEQNPSAIIQTALIGVAQQHAPSAAVTSAYARSSCCPFLIVCGTRRPFSAATPHECFFFRAHIRDHEDHSDRRFACKYLYSLCTRICTYSTWLSCLAFVVLTKEFHGYLVCIYLRVLSHTLFGKTANLKLISIVQYMFVMYIVCQSIIVDVIA